MASFFSNLPDIYVGIEVNETIEYRLVKNIFRRVKLEEELDRYSTAFEGYYIPPGVRPDMIAQDVYGDAELEWIILLTNNITDIYSQWPLDDYTLLEFVNSKYGSADDVHHWETNEVKYNDAIFLKRGIEVNESFRVSLPDGTTLSKDQSIYPVSNIEYETYVNEKKRLIAIPNSTLVEFFERDFQDLVDYQPNKEVDAQGNKKTPNSLAGRFLNRASYRKSSRSQSLTNSEVVTSFDYGPTSGVTSTTGTTSNAESVINNLNVSTTDFYSASTTTSTSGSSSVTTPSSGSSGY